MDIDTATRVAVESVRAVTDTLYPMLAEKDATIASLRKRVEELEGEMRKAAEYLRKLEDNMLSNDADMMLDDCLPPSFHADQIDQALTQEPTNAD